MVVMLDMLYAQQLSMNGKWGKKVIIFYVDNSLSLHADNRKKHILVLGEGLTTRLDGTAITVEEKYSVNITRFRKKFV